MDSLSFYTLLSVGILMGFLSLLTLVSEVLRLIYEKKFFYSTLLYIFVLAGLSGFMFYLAFQYK